MKRQAADKLTDQQFSGIFTEYNSLRAEILKRIELRNSIAFSTLTFAGVLLGFGLTKPSLALIYVILSMFLASSWVQSDVKISELGRYIRERLEKPETKLYWETFIHDQHVQMAAKRKFQPSVVFSTGGVFLITQLVAIAVAITQLAQYTLLEWLLSAAALICIAVTIAFFQYSSRQF